MQSFFDYVQHMASFQVTFCDAVLSMKRCTKSKWSTIFGAESRNTMRETSNGAEQTRPVAEMITLLIRKPTPRRRFGVIITLLLRRVPAGEQLFWDKECVSVIRQAVLSDKQCHH